MDDDDAVRALVARVLTGAGHVVLEADDALGAVEHLGADCPPDLVVLDVGLPGVNGMDLLRRIRSKSQVPVIMLTGRVEEADRIEGLRSGADDYVMKPFSPGELVARVETVLRRAAPRAPAARMPANGQLVYDGLEVDHASREVRVAGRSVPVTAREFDLLAFLAASPRQVFTREQLLRQVWESSTEWQDDATVTEHVRRVRRKIEPDPDHPRWVVTVRGVGYRFEP